MMEILSSWSTLFIFFLSFRDWGHWTFHVHLTLFIFLLLCRNSSTVVFNLLYSSDRVHLLFHVSFFLLGDNLKLVWVLLSKLVNLKVVKFHGVLYFIVFCHFFMILFECIILGFKILVHYSATQKKCFFGLDMPLRKRNYFHPFLLQHLSHLSNLIPASCFKQESCHDAIPVEILNLNVV